MCYASIGFQQVNPSVALSRMYALTHIFSDPRVRIAFFCAIFLLGVSSPASAAIMFCNRTHGPIEAAIGYQNKGKWMSEGWWRIEPGLCSRVFSKPLSPHNNYYYYAYALATAEKGKTPFVWDGDYRFCAVPKAFRIQSVENCEKKGFQTKGFRKIEPDPNSKSYSLDFKDK